MNPICLECREVMKTKKTGIVFSNYPEDDPFPKIYSGDVFECPVCRHRIIGSIGKRTEIRKEDYTREIHYVNGNT